MKQLKAAMGVVLCLLLANGVTARAGWTSADTQRVLNQLHANNLLERDAGKLARDNSGSDDIKNYGDMLASDRERADQKVSDLAGDQHLVVNEKPLLDSETSATLQRLHRLHGAELDRQFLDMVMTDQESMIALVKAWQSDAQDKPLIALLDELLPTLQKERMLAGKLSERKHTAASAGL